MRLWRRYSKFAAPDQKEHGITKRLMLLKGYCLGEQFIRQPFLVSVVTERYADKREKTTGSIHRLKSAHLN